MDGKSKMKEILACSYCRKTVTNPQTLRCYHSFCNHCLKQLTRDVGEGKNGLVCSVCKVFSHESKSDLLINELLEMFQISEKGEVGACQQCTKKQSNWNCQDCKMVLCDDCHEQHLRVPLLKNHHIRPVNVQKDAEMVIDRVVFCSIHDDEPVKLNCVECALPLCIKCKVTEHENHKTETVEKAIERIIPLLNSDSTKIQEKINGLDKMKVEIKQQMEETKQVYCKTRLDADEHLKQLTTSVKSQHKALSEELIVKEEEELAKLEIAQEKIDYKLKEYENLCRWVELTNQAAKGTSLLAEVESGLLERVNDVAFGRFKLSAIIDHPSLGVNEAQVKMEDMVGKLKYSKVVAVSSNVTNSGGKHITKDLSGLVDKKYRVIHNINLPDICYRLSIINEEIWVPIPLQNDIQVYNLKGELLRTSKQPDKQARAVVQLSSGEIIMACNVGLYMLDENEVASKQIASGNFSDIDVIDDSVSALNSGNCHFVRYKQEGHHWKLSDSFKLRTFNNTGTLNSDDQYFYVGSSSSYTVQKYNKNGQSLGDIGIHTGQFQDDSNPGDLYAPYISMMDDTGNMLVCDYNNARLQLLISDFEWKIVAYNGKPDQLGNPFDCKCDSEGCLWVVNNNKKLICYGY